MQINLYIIIPVIVAAGCLIAWLVYRNTKDEWKFEKDMDTKGELHWKEDKPKNKHT
jgi:hypothetical protein